MCVLGGGVSWRGGGAGGGGGVRCVCWGEAEKECSKLTQNNTHNLLLLLDKHCIHKWRWNQKTMYITIINIEKALFFPTLKILTICFCTINATESYGQV